MDIIDKQMERNDELTSPGLTKLIYEEFGLNFSIQKVKRLRQKLAWVQTGTKYCQLIHEPNRIKRLEFSEKCLRENEQFNNLTFTDECSVFMENHSKTTFHPKWEQPKIKGRPKHPLKVHVWVGNSKRGPTELMIFEGCMDAEFYVTEIFSNGLLPFVQETFPDGHRFQQDNDPKHTSQHTKTFMEENSINWWKTLPESPDLNPIELVWHELKHFLWNVVKPYTKEELINGITRFWAEKVNAKKCTTYIGHMQKVLPLVVARQGRASGK